MKRAGSDPEHISQSSMREWLSMLTSTGRAVAVIMVAAFAIGALLDWPEFVAMSAALLASFAISIASMHGGKQFGVERTLHPSRISAGQEAIGVLTVRNLGRRRRRATRAVDKVGATVIAVDIPPLDAQSVVSLPFTVHGERRGRVTVGPLVIGRADPFGLLHRRQAEGEVTHVMVHPRTVVTSVSGSGWTKDLEGLTTEDSPLGSVAFHSLRDYQPGDDRRHIHWRSSARAGHPIVRQFVDTRRSTTWRTSSLASVDR